MPRYAAIDIGSNSVRMEAAEFVPGFPMQILAADRAVTRLGESVFRSGRISEQAMELTCGVLARMANQYRAVDVAAVRAVATSSVRDARNQSEFVERASEVLGASVEVVSGREEARLIHMGVHARWPHPHQRLLIIDIGGGSAEIMASEHGRMTDAISRPLGAVRLWEMFLESDPPQPSELTRMQEFLAEKLAGARHRFGQHAWDRAIVTSATGAAAVCAIRGVPRNKREQADRQRVSRQEVKRLYRTLSRMKLAERRQVAGIGPRRAEIIVAGLGVLGRILEELEVDAVSYSAAGLRDGIIADLAARNSAEAQARLSDDQRREVQAMSRRFGVLAPHARKVAALSSTLFQAMAPLHNVSPQFGRVLEAAAYLHDVGHFIADSSHHKHSYYVVANADMPGFTVRERQLIANLCRYHRKAMPTPDHENLRPLTAEERRVLLQLIPLLRVADNLDRSHRQKVGDVTCDIHDNAVVLRIWGDGDTELERWAASRSGDVFQEVFGRPLVIQP